MAERKGAKKGVDDDELTVQEKDELERVANEAICSGSPVYRFDSINKFAPSFANRMVNFEISIEINYLEFP